MFRQRSQQREIIDDLSYCDPLLINNLQEMEKINDWLGYHRILIKGVKKVYTKYKFALNKKIVLADMGCGSADALRVIDGWMQKNSLNCDLIGVDANEFVLKYAAERSIGYRIKFEQRNALAQIKEKHYDIVIVNHLCHHLNNFELINLLKNLIDQTRVAIIINDLHRHVLAYLGIKLLAKIFNFSMLTKHDGPLSVLRGFRKNELIALLAKTGIQSFEIQWCWPFRWQIIIWSAISQGVRMHEQ